MDFMNSQEVRNIVLAISALVLLAIFPVVQIMITALVIGSTLYAVDGGVINGIGFGLISNYGTISEGIMILLSWLGITVSLDAVEVAIVAGCLLAVAGGVGLI